MLYRKLLGAIQDLETEMEGVRGALELARFEGDLVAVVELHERLYKLGNRHEELRCERIARTHDRGRPCAHTVLWSARAKAQRGLRI